MLLKLKVIASISNDYIPLISGKGLSIKGRVSQLGLPLPCYIRLFEKDTGRLIFEKLTDTRGFYEFDHLTKTKFFIVAHHPASQFNAVIQDNVVPK